MIATSAEIPVLEIGGTHVTAASIQPDGWTVAAQRRVSLQAGHEADEWLGAVLSAAAAISVEPGAHWAVAVPGPFDYAEGVARYRDVGKFDGLYGFDVGSALLAGIQPRPSGVSFVNDASAFAVGEWLVGAARGVSRFVAITLGTGVGSAFIADGQAVEDGPQVPPDAEVHLLRRDGVPLEELVSRRALIARYRAATGDESDIDVREIADLARSGGPAAAVFATAFTVLGEMLGPWVAAFEAETLVVGGSIANAWDLVAQPLANGLAAVVDGSTPRVTPRRALDAERAALVGAAYAAGRRRPGAHGAAD